MSGPCFASTRTTCETVRVRARLARATAGFTLLEVLTALTVLGMLLLMLGQGVRSGLQASGVQARALRAIDGLDTVDRVVRSLIEGMSPGGIAGRPPYFAGGDRSLSFTGDLPPDHPGSPPRAADVTLVVDRARRLTLLWAPHSPLPNAPAPAAASAPLLDGVDRVEFRYWSAEGGWQTPWRGQTLPGLIRIRIVFPRGDIRHWPDIVVGPARDRPRP